MLTTAPRGTSDVLPDQSGKWQNLEAVIRSVCREYNYGEIRTPIFEHSELFHRTVGETSDIVQKETYTFVDRGGRSITLRPEGTAGAVRAFIEHNMASQGLPLKVYYIGPMFRYEKPQGGRMRQFTQFGVEILGSPSPVADAETILLAMDLFKRIGLGSLALEINSIGCPKCRDSHRKELLAYLQPLSASLCKTCRERLVRNPLRVLDCKEPDCQQVVENAPKTLDYLCEECAQHFKTLREILDSFEIGYSINPRLVRGLDYYTRTVFEISSSALGAQSAVCAGGRYDGLVEALGEEPTPGVGFGLGMERLVLALQQNGRALFPEDRLDAYVCPLCKEAVIPGFNLLSRLREAGMRADIDMMDRSLRAQMKCAGRVNARYAVLIGQDELLKGTVTLRNMDLSDQQQVLMGSVVEEIGKMK